MGHVLVQRSTESPSGADNFPACLAFVLSHHIEGGISARPKRDDPGGLTNMGITEGTLADYLHDYPEDTDMPDDVRNLTREKVTRIYQRMFWDEIDGNDLPAPIALVVFNAAVQSGPKRAARWLQMTLDVKVDGIIGKATKRAAQMAIPRVAIRNFLKLQLLFEMELANWESNKGGWMSRLFDVAWMASAMRPIVTKHDIQNGENVFS